MRGGRCQETQGSSTSLIIGSVAILVRDETAHMVFEIIVQGQFFPFHARDFEKDFFPIASGDGGRRLDGALNEQPLFCAAPCGSSDFLLFPDNIELLRANETLPGPSGYRFRSEFGPNSRSNECLLNPCVHALVTLDCLQVVPGACRWKDETVSPIAIMWY